MAIWKIKHALGINFYFKVLLVSNHFLPWFFFTNMNFWYNLIVSLKELLITFLKLHKNQIKVFTSVFLDTRHSIILHLYTFVSNTTYLLKFPTEYLHNWSSPPIFPCVFSFTVIILIMSHSVLFKIQANIISWLKNKLYSILIWGDFQHRTMHHISGRKLFRLPRNSFWSMI